MSAQPAPLTPAQLIELGEAIYNASNETAGPLYLHPQRAAILADMARAAIGALEGMGLVIVPRTDRNAHSAPPVQAELLSSIAEGQPLTDEEFSALLAPAPKP